MAYKPKDRFYDKAKQDRFVARSVYKLEEIDRRYRIFSKGDRVIDLGASPGSWLQYVSSKVGKKGCVVAYDLEPLRVGAPNCVFSEADVTTLEAERVRQDLFELVDRLRGKEAREGPPPKTFQADGLISDMAPKLTGIRDADQAKSVELVGHALRLARILVKPKGYFVAKLFQGRDTDELVKDVKTAFKDVKLLKPEATREGSREVFVMGLHRRDIK